MSATTVSEERILKDAGDEVRRLRAGELIRLSRFTQLRDEFVTHCDGTADRFREALGVSSEEHSNWNIEAHGERRRSPRDNQAQHAFSRL